MKKYTTILLCVAAISNSFGAAINWNLALGAQRLNSYASGVIGSKSGTQSDYFIGSLYMIFLSDLSGVTGFEASSDSTASSEFTSYLDSIALSGGASLTIPAEKNGKDTSVRTVIDDRLTWKEYYDVALVVWDEANGAYWISGSLTAAAYDPALISEYPSIDYGFAASGATAPLNGGALVKEWTHIPVVPEPASAGLALAGLALLFRRRRR